MLLSSPNKHRPLLQDWCAASVQYLVLYNLLHFTMQWRVTYKGKAYAKEAFSSPITLYSSTSVWCCAYCQTMQCRRSACQVLVCWVSRDTNTTNKISRCSKALWNRTILGWCFRPHCGPHIMVAQSDWWATMTKMMMVVMDTMIAVLRSYLASGNASPSVACAHNWTNLM